MGQGTLTNSLIKIGLLIIFQSLNSIQKAHKNLFFAVLVLLPNNFKLLIIGFWIWENLGLIYARLKMNYWNLALLFRLPSWNYHSLAPRGLIDPDPFGSYRYDYVCLSVCMSVLLSNSLTKCITSWRSLTLLFSGSS